MENILVPTDFSEKAENALKVAAQIARKFNTEIYLLHLIELPADMVNPVGETRSNDLPEALFFMKLAKKNFDDLLSRPYLRGLKVHDIVEINKAFNGIMEASKKHNCDFVVMGSHGATGLREMFIGSNTEKVVRTSEVPVLVVKNEHENFKIESLVFATNLDNTAKKTLEKVIALAKTFDARLHLVFINTANEFLTTDDCDKRLVKFMEGTDFDNYEFHVFNDESVEKGILNFSKKINADVMAIATHGRKGLSHFFNGSISEDLVNHANSPVMTFKLEK